MPTQTSKHTAKIVVRYGRAQLGNRNFYAVEAGPGTTLGGLGPWAIVENNGGRMKPIIICEGISGTRKNAERVLARGVAAIARAMENL